MLQKKQNEMAKRYKERIIKTFDDDKTSPEYENVGPRKKKQKKSTEHAIKIQHVLSLFPDDKSFGNLLKY